MCSPLISIITVTLNDAWALSKTIKSVAMQTARDQIEYIIIDGDSVDDTHRLVKFWSELNVIGSYHCAQDDGVYSAMNRGVSIARGEYILFMNAGDTFNSNEDLSLVVDRLDGSQFDGLLGWGLLKNQVWASWHLEMDAFRMASLGFCHQGLYLKRKWLKQIPFMTEQGQTDSDTRQLADCIAAGAKIALERRPLAIRSPSDGISANLAVTRRSISATIREGYPLLSDSEIDKLISFRRGCEYVYEVSQLMDSLDVKTRLHIALMVLDTLTLKQSVELAEEQVDQLMEQALDVIWSLESPQQTIGELAATLSAKRAILDRRRVELFKAEQKNQVLQEEVLSEDVEPMVLDSNASSLPIVCLTTHPGRVTGLSLVVQSLLRQSLQPQKICLIVGKDEFKNQWQFPEDVYRLVGDQFEIVFVDRTKHQYDKFLQTSDLNDIAPVCIVDDDVVYPSDMLEKLFKCHLEYPDAVIANRCHQMTLDHTGELEEYKEWQQEVSFDKPRHDLFPTGSGGVLYPQGFFGGASNEGDILELCPYADDVWLKAVSILGGYPVKTTSDDANSWKLGYATNVSDQPLHQANVDFGLNDIQIRRAFSWLEQQGVDWRSKLSDSGE